MIDSDMEKVFAALANGRADIELRGLLSQSVPLCTRLRDKACDLAPGNPEEAYKLAETITEPWYKGQALAYVARYCDNAHVTVRAREAMEAFAASSDVYDAVAGAAWPIRALIERDCLGEAGEVLDKALARAASIDKNVRKADAVFHLFEAASIVPEFADSLIDVVVDACMNARSWRGPMLLKRALLIHASVSPARAAAVMARLPDSRAKRHVLACRESGHLLEPRAFFWRAAP